MDFLNKTYVQFLELFRSATPAARVTTGLLLVAVVVSLGYLFRFQGDAPDAFLFGAQVLSQREINNMELAFGKAGLNGFHTEQYRIRVPRAQRANYLAALVENNAFPEHPGYATKEMLRSHSALEPRDIREQKYRRADEQDLGSTIRAVKGIEEAFVEITEMESGGIRRRKEKQALVSVRPSANTQLDARAPIQAAGRRRPRFGLQH